MKIRTKLTLEVIVLISLIGAVSVFSITNTKQLQESFDNLNSNTIPALDNLRDMRLASTLYTSSTMEILLIENQARHAQGIELRELEEELEFEYFEIENAKALFDKALSDYSVYLETDLPDGIGQKYVLQAEWNRLVNSGTTLVLLEDQGASSNEILKAKDEFEDAQQVLNQEIFSAISFTTNNLDVRQNVVKSTINDTIISIIITLNIFIFAALGIRYFILRSISKPLIKLRKTATEIAEGNFVKTELKGHDEISDLGHDIDKMSQDLEKLNKQIITTERLTSIGSLASRLAHDLRNPLAVIKNSLEIMTLKLSPEMNQKVDHQMALMGRAVSRMSHQIEGVMNFVNIAEVKLQSCSVITIIESAILSTDIPKSVKIDMPKNSATIMGDPYRLEVVFSNLLKNSCQAMDEKGKITIRLAERDNDVLIGFEDSGPGISESNLRKIFEPLFTTKQVGTGLGLASCKSIIEKHGGAITVRNNPTIFTIQLPKNPNLASVRKKLTEKALLNE